MPGSLYRYGELKSQWGKMGKNKNFSVEKVARNANFYLYIEQHLMSTCYICGIMKGRGGNR